MANVVLPLCAGATLLAFWHHAHFAVLLIAGMISFCFGGFHVVDLVQDHLASIKAGAATTATIVNESGPSESNVNLGAAAEQAALRVREFARAWRWQRDRQTIADVQDGVDTTCALSIEDLEIVLKRAGFGVETLAS